MLPLSLVANRTYPYDAKLEQARRYLTAKGITNPRPIRRSASHSEFYQAWLARSRPRLKLITSGPIAH